jgi:hypothetical protein
VLSGRAVEEVVEEVEEGGGVGFNVKWNIFSPYSIKGLSIFGRGGGGIYPPQIHIYRKIGRSFGILCQVAQIWLYIHSYQQHLPYLSLNTK